MVEPSDQNLIHLIRQGDESAFVTLIKRYEHPIAMLIRYNIPNPADAEDVFQEVLLQAWVGLRQREPGNVRAWLMQATRNRCTDYFRSPQRRIIPTDSPELEQRIERSNLHLNRHRGTVDTVVEMLEEVPQTEREVARLFYLEGLTINEIAERHRCPAGTVKRRLFSARDHLRRALGIQIGGQTMTGKEQRFQPFPAIRPDINITLSSVEAFTVDCPEMRCWYIIPEVGQRAMAADYAPPKMAIRGVIDLHAARPASVEGMECVEIEVRWWDPEIGWQKRDTPLGRVKKELKDQGIDCPPHMTLFGRLTETKSQCLAELTREERTQLRTFLESGFAWAFPELDRNLENNGLFETLSDGSLKTTRPLTGLDYSATGIFDVTIGDKTFTCLRVTSLEDDPSDPSAVVTESYLTREGRTVLYRNYCHPATARELGHEVDESTHMTVSGETFMLWYDSVTGLGCGIDK